MNFYLDNRVSFIIRYFTSLSRCLPFFSQLSDRVSISNGRVWNNTSNLSNEKIIDWGFRCLTLYAWYYTLSWICECCHIHRYRLVLGDGKVDSSSSLSPTNGNSLKTHCWVRWEFLIPVHFNLEHYQPLAVNKTQSFRVYFYDFVNISQVIDGNISYLDSIWLLSTSTGPGFVSMLPDSIILRVTKQIF